MSIITLRSSIEVDGTMIGAITIELAEDAMNEVTDFLKEVIGDIMKHANASKVSAMMAGFAPTFEGGALNFTDAVSAYPPSFTADEKGTVRHSTEDDMMDPDNPIEP